MDKFPEISPSTRARALKRFRERFKHGGSIEAAIIAAVAVVSVDCPGTTDINLLIQTVKEWIEEEGRY
jgi:hypothetical protein